MYSAYAQFLCLFSSSITILFSSFFPCYASFYHFALKIFLDFSWRIIAENSVCISLHQVYFWYMCNRLWIVKALFPSSYVLVWQPLAETHTMKSIFRKLPAILCTQSSMLHPPIHTIYLTWNNIDIIGKKNRFLSDATPKWKISRWTNERRKCIK